MCFECIELLLTAFKFKQKFDESTLLLKDYLANLNKNVEEEREVNVFELDLKSLKEHFWGKNKRKKKPETPQLIDPPNNINQKVIKLEEKKPSTETTLNQCPTITIKLPDSELQKPVVTPKVLKKNANIPNESKSKKNKSARSKNKTVEDEISDEEEIAYVEVAPILHQCPICTVELRASELREHALTHKALKHYTNIPNHLKPKKNAHYIAKRRNPNDPSFYQQPIVKHLCPYCKKSFPGNEFGQHLDIHRHQTDEFNCDKCERVFRKLRDLNIHRLKHLEEYPYKCEHCGKGFVIKRNYDCHILTHTNDELPHECQYCFKRFSNPEHLKRHQFIHTETVSYSEKYKVCKCTHCLRSFKDKTAMKNHNCVPIAQQQSGQSRFTCKKCNKVFKYSSGLSNHNRLVHKLKNVKVLCSVCGSYVANIYNHMFRHSGEKPYVCNQCDKRFSSKPQLKQHLLVHSGLKPFVCSICGKTFNNLYNLQVHERMHKGNKCHICPVCNKGFLEKSYLKKHIKVHNIV